jgi:hypothetical protein
MVGGLGASTLRGALGEGWPGSEVGARRRSSRNGVGWAPARRFKAAILYAVRHWRNRARQASRTGTEGAYMSGKFRLHGFVVRLDHVHLSMTVGGGMTVEKAMQSGIYCEAGERGTRRFAREGSLLFCVLGNEKGHGG